MTHNLSEPIAEVRLAIAPLFVRVVRSLYYIYAALRSPYYRN
ncbi:hypothetical protein [Microcoleus sp. FACHB-831]|nr:hypothetical protein [Microcoleus sp. FACHB-831]